MTELEKPNHVYKIKEVVRVIDGDTVDLNLDLGLYITVMKRIRMLEIDTDELRGGTVETKKRAKAAKLRLIELLAEGDVYIQTEMDSTGKYGRLLGTLFVEMKDGTMLNINQTLVDEGFQKGDKNTNTVIEWIKKLVTK